jgi:hypothetical protein
MNKNVQEIQIKPTIFSKENLRLLALILLTIISILIISLAERDSTTYYNSTLLYTVFILFFIIIVFTYIINGFDSKSKGFIYIFLAIVFTLIMIINILFNVGLVNLITNDYITNGVLICIILIGMAIFYYLVLEKLVTRPGWISFIIKFLFYIPCLFIDIIKYLIKDFQSTSSIILYLLFIEFVLIFIYYYLYPRLESSVYDNGFILLKNPLPLNKETRIDSGFYTSLVFKNPNPESNSVNIYSQIRNTFSLSMWIYINSESTSQLSYVKENIVFSYENHPKITYKNNEKGDDKLIFYLSPNTIYETNFQYQKWINIVLNYRDSFVDLFINGNLEKTIKLKEIPIYTNNDKIIIGENGINDRTGLYGSICNITYYKNIMTKGQIIDNYNLLSIHNPPIL